MGTAVTGLNQATRDVPPHLAGWELPSQWRWGSGGIQSEHRHVQEVIDALGRSLALVTAPNPEHHPWLEAEARALAHRNHPSVPTTYDYWSAHRDEHRGPGYLRRWIEGETIGSRIARRGAEDVPYVLQVLRTAGSALVYLHDLGSVHGAVGPDSVWVSPTGRLWLLAWQWAVPRDAVPAGIIPNRQWTPAPPEWAEHSWMPDARSDQWQLAAMCFALLTGERPPSDDVPPLRLLRADCPQVLATLLERALQPDPAARYPSIATMLRTLERVTSGRHGSAMGEGEDATAGQPPDTPEARLRWAVGDDYEVLAPLGSGTFGSVWRVRDLSLQREVALKMLHPEIARDDAAVARFRREAQLAAHLAHPAIVPIYDWDGRGDVAWYTMELLEGGSIGDLVARAGARSVRQVGAQVELVLDGLAAAHMVGVVHRDLKPENILIDRYRRWRISDFGIAHIPGETSGGAIGTPSFAAPEQLLGEAQGAAVDCFALAAIVAFVLSGVPPFGDGDARTILARQLSRETDFSAYPVPIGEWLERGLAVNVADRFADAAEMRDAWRVAFRAATRAARRAAWWRGLVRPAGAITGR